MNISLKDFEGCVNQIKLIDLPNVKLYVDVNIETGKVSYFAGRNEGKCKDMILHEFDELSTALQCL